MGGGTYIWVLFNKYATEAAQGTPSSWAEEQEENKEKHKMNLRNDES